MSRHQILETERLHLRPLESSDCDRIFEFMSLRDVTTYLLFFNYPIQRIQVQSWLESVLEAKPEWCAYWGICDKKDGKLIGIIGLTLTSYHSKGEIGYWLDKDYWNQGVATEAAWRVIEYGFHDLKLHRIEITHMVEAKASQRVIEKLGFQLEGAWREGHCKAGKYHDVKLYGMLDVDYQRAKKLRAVELLASVKKLSN